MLRLNFNCLDFSNQQNGASYGAKDDKSLKFYFKSGQIMAFAGGIVIFLLTFFGADAASIPIVCDALPKYCLS